MNIKVFIVYQINQHTQIPFDLEKEISKKRNKIRLKYLRTKSHYISIVTNKFVCI